MTQVRKRIRQQTDSESSVANGGELASELARGVNPEVSATPIAPGSKNVAAKDVKDSSRDDVRRSAPSVIRKRNSNSQATPKKLLQADHAATLDQSFAQSTDRTFSPSIPMSQNLVTASPRTNFSAAQPSTQFISNGKPGTLKIIPLGGLHEIGKNTCIFEYEDEIMMLDAGLAFPTDGMHGIQIVLPDMTYLRDNREKIKGMIVTHGHEDHIGGIAFHLKQVDIPVIYGPRLAMALLSDKLEEAGVSDRTEIRTVGPREFVRVGTKFLVEFIRNTHSMADSFSVAIHTPLGVVIHTGDFKFDHTPVDGEYFDLQRLAEYGEKGVLCLISDSTNAEIPGFTPSEKSVYPNLERAFAKAPGRLLVTTFASSVHRVNMILDIAHKQGRVVSVLGRSMLNTIAHARNLGYVKCPDDLFVPIHELQNYPDHKVVILTTGSQGEPLSALTRISKGEHRQIKIRNGDTVVLSANPIPGNTIAVVNTIDRLMMLGANVVYGRDKGIHVSGHGSQEDHKLMISLTRPKFFMPVHGEHRMLVKHAEIAQSLGIPADNMVIIENGDVVELTQDSIKIGDRVPSGIELVDASRSGVVSDRALRERQQLANEGLVTVAASIYSTGQLACDPQVHMSGVVSSIDPSKLTGAIGATLKNFLSNRFERFVTNPARRSDDDIDWGGLKVELEREFQRLLRRDFVGTPQVVVLVQPIAAPISVRRDRPAPAAPTGNTAVAAATDSIAPESPAAPSGRRRRRTAASVAS
ncbi:ribonuclease J [Limnothrix sp. PR1529]|uniref:ribonuclease J n=1 Tax=Limnothrix sp. PR1529 TaxID=1704291 RepID=UPI000A6EBF6E|nr:ribonuclease J [Limnothrix sp. PR1529]